MSPKGKKLTLKEVAKHLGVSTATVSNAFNRPDQLSAKLREKILTESAELGYTGPNLAARSLRRGESEVVAVVLADSLSYSFSDPVASQLLQGVADELAANNKQLLLLTSEGDSKEQSMAESLPDGFIFYGAPQNESIQRIVKAGKPAIAIDFQHTEIGSVNIDNCQAAKVIAAHAIDSAAEQISVLGLKMLDSDRICRLVPEDMARDSDEPSPQRLLGYRQAAEEAGNHIAAERVWHIPLNTPDQAEIAAREALTTQPTPEVLLCMSDVIALAALRVAKELNIHVPTQLKIVGFDDIPESSRSMPKLTTICQQSKEKGRLAAQMLLTGEEMVQRCLPTKLILRDSV